MDLKAIMQQKEMSKYRLSKLSGVSYSHITDIANGVSMPGIVIAQKLAAALGVTIAELIDGSDQQAATWQKTG